MLEVNKSIGTVIILGAPTKYVPVNSSIEIRKTKIELASSPGRVSGRVMSMNARSRDAPKLLAAISSFLSTAAKDAVVILSAKPAKLKAGTTLVLWNIRYNHLCYKTAKNHN